MHTRLHAGWKYMLLATSVACLVVFPALDAIATEVTPLVKQETSGLARVVEEQEEQKGPTLYPRANYKWPFATGPHYGTVDPTRARVAGTLHTSVGSFDLASGLINFPAELRTTNRLGIQPLQYFVLQMDPATFQNGTFESLRASIETQGGSFVREMPIASFIVRLNQAAMGAIQSSTGVLAVEPYHPAFKLNPAIGRAGLADPFKAVSEVYTLDVAVHKGENTELLAGALAELGGNVVTIHSDAVRVDIHRDRIPAIAAMESVSQIYEARPNYINGEETTNVMQTGEYCPGGGCGPIPYHAAGVHGGGNGGDVGPQVIMVLDTGIQLDNGDLSDTETSPGTPGTGHRKVLVNASTGLFGGIGDTVGCDHPLSGSYTHGHMVSATAVGWGTDVIAPYGTGWELEDTNGVAWKLDGVAPRAKLVFYDGGTVCPEYATNAGVSAGNVYSALSQGYTEGARISNFSWGDRDNNTYGLNASRIDDFLNDPDKLDAMVFVSAGNESSDDDNDGIPDPETVSDPSTCKNCVVMGGTGNAADLGTNPNFDEDDRYGSSSVGPVFGGRVAPILMAPGTDGGAMGLDSEYSCRGDDDDQTGDVKCLVNQGSSGTSFASPAGAGAALLLRDYFAQGFYPDGTDTNLGNDTDKEPDVSGALVKAALIASADWVGKGNNRGANLTKFYRFNNEQGYGRIQLDRVLPLQTWAESVVGLVVADGGINGGPNNMGLAGEISTGQTHTYEFEPCDTGVDLSASLAWIEANTATLQHDLDLELESPSGDIYWGNYYTDDNNRSGLLDAGEDCPGFDGTGGELDESPWSLPVCGNSIRDTANPTEAIHLSVDPDGDEVLDDGLSQIESGTWTLRVKASGTVTNQRYAVALAGGVCLTSSVRFNRVSHICNDMAQITVNEVDEGGDPGSDLTPAIIRSRTTVQVLVNDVVVDEETGITFTQPDVNALQFVSEDIVLTDGTAPDPGNGALDVQDGAILRVNYQDTVEIRKSSASVDCSAEIGFGNLVFGNFGLDTITDVDGGCETNARGGFEFGYPDRHIDAAETVDYGFAFFNNDTSDLLDAVATLRCVEVDGDSTADCRPETTPGDVCADPKRLNNPDCSDLDGSGNGIVIISPEKVMGDIPSGAAIAAHFMVSADSGLTGKHKIEMILGVSSPKASKGVEGLAVSRHNVNVDQVSFYYSTDYLTGGTEHFDYNGNETLENPITNIGDFLLDYRFETVTWSDATATGKNGALGAPWDFDSDPVNFSSGVGAISDDDRIIDIIAQWGEDKDFNGSLTPGLNEDRDPANGSLDKAWGLGGGCGWMTQNTTSNRGAWHTGNAYTAGAGTCMVQGANPGQCQEYETISLTTAAEKAWFELMLTPIVEKVNQGVDADGDDIYTIEHLNWAWNHQLDLRDNFILFTWEFDTDTTDPDPVGLVNDANIFNLAAGMSPVGFTGLGNVGLNTPDTHIGEAGYPVFRDPYSTGHLNPSGPNHESDAGCFFNNPFNLNPALPVMEPYPLDDDVDNDGDSSQDEYVDKNGPIRNADLTTWNGPDLRFTTMEDIYGPSGNSFQGALGILVSEGDGTAGGSPIGGYGVGVDDMVMQWREFRLDEDTTTCAGECATLQVQTTNFYEGNALVTITAIEKTPTCASEGCSTAGHNNDCDLDGIPDGTDNCDASTGDTNPDIVVEVYNDLRSDSEIVFLNRTGEAGGAEYQGTVPISSSYNVDGTLFVERIGTDAPTLAVDYWDNDYNGLGDLCNNDPDPAGRGLVQAFTAVLYDTAIVGIKSVRLVDNGDGDAFADTNETVEMYVTLTNTTGIDLNNVVLRASTNSTNIGCITNPIAVMGDYTGGDPTDPDYEKEGLNPIVFQVAPGANRTGEFQDFFADFNITISADEFDGLYAPQKITLDLDFDVSGGGTNDVFTEDFEGSGLGTFTEQRLDDGHIADNAASNDYRCQYNDPEFFNSNSYGEDSCHLGPDVYGWHVHTATDPDGGRGYSGGQSLHWGFHDISGLPDLDTHHLGQLEAVALKESEAVHLDYANLPELTFKHQASFADWRITNTPFLETPVRGVVMLKLMDGGSSTGDWIKLQPYLNVHDAQGTDNFVDCLFDPIDDGSDEDSFFDPGDPDRRLGPSSTCFPEFAYSWIGSTDYRAAADPDNIGGASDGPGLTGDTGNGTWIESKFSLDRFRGRSVIFRFVTSAIEVDDTATVEALFDLEDGDPGDDGWYIDEFQVLNTLSSAANMTPDGTNNSGLPDNCANNCTLVTADLTADPPSSPAPGHLTQLNAVASTTNACISGTLQFQFWTDDNASGTLDTTNDTIVRDWTDNPVLFDAPLETTHYAVRVRCSSVPGCNDDFFYNSPTGFVVTCPSTGNAGFGDAIGFESNKTDITWASVSTIDMVQGDLDALLAANGNYNGTVDTCVANDVSTDTVTVGSTPSVGNGFYYLVRAASGGACNATQTYGDSNRDTGIGADPNACP